MKPSHILFFFSTFFGHSAIAAEYPNFIVSRAAVDPSLNNSQKQFSENDPIFYKRLFYIKNYLIYSDLDSNKCRKSGGKSRQTLNSWLYNNFPYDSVSYDQEGNPSRRHDQDASTFQLNYPANEHYETDSWKCDQNIQFERMTFPDGNMGIARKDLGILLLLRPYHASEQITPSFDCNKASTVTEKSICSDISLSGWDASLFAKFKSVMAGLTPGNDGQTKLINIQKKWLIQRNKCQAERECISAEYQKQMEFLIDIIHSDYHLASDNNDSIPTEDIQWLKSYLQKKQQ